MTQVRKILALLLCLTMVFSFFPASALAEGEENEQTVSEEGPEQEREALEDEESTAPVGEEPAEDTPEIENSDEGEDPPETRSSQFRRRRWTHCPRRTTKRRKPLSLENAETT